MGSIVFNISILEIKFYATNMNIFKKKFLPEND